MEQTKPLRQRPTRSTAPPRLVRVLSAEHGTLTALWTNGETRVVDFNPLLAGAWKTDPYLSQLAIPAKFASAVVEHGVLHWPTIQTDTSDCPGMPPSQPLDLDPDLVFSLSQPLASFDIRPNMAAYLRQLRQESGLTQEELAARIGFKKSYISKLESGKTDVQLGTFSWILFAGFGKKPLYPHSTAA